MLFALLLVQAQSEILDRLEATRVTLDVSDAPIENVLDAFRSSFKTKIIVDSAVREKRDVDDLKLTLRLKDATGRAALRTVLRTMKLAAVIRDGAISITTREKVEPPVTHVYEIADVHYQPPDFPGPTLELTPPRKAPPTGCTFLIERSPVG